MEGFLLKTPPKSRRSSGFVLRNNLYNEGIKYKYVLKEEKIMAKKFIAKMLVAVLLFSTVLSVRAYAGENDIPRVFQRSSIIEPFERGDN